MNEDVVAEIDRWRTTARTAANAYEFVPLNELLDRARDEIMTLRERLESILKEYDQADHRMQEYDALENALDRARTALGWHYDNRTDEWVQPT